MTVINEVFAFVSIDAFGNEWIPAIQVTEGWLPLVSSDMARIEVMTPKAREVAQQTGQTMKIYRFSVREQIGEVNP